MSRVSNGGSYEWQIINDGTTYSVDNLSGGKLIERLYEKLSIGNVMSRQLELTLYDVTIDPTKSITLKINALTSSGASTIYNRGVYFIDTIEKSPYSDFTQITAYDAMLKANVAYMKTGTWTSRTDKSIVQDIAANILGVSIESNTLTLLNTTKTIDQAPSIGDNGTSARDMLSVIAIMRGGNWIINDANELEFVPLTGRLNPHATVVVGDDVVRFDVSPSESVTRVELWENSTTSYRSPSGLTEAAWDALGGIVLSANMPMMASQTLADSLYTSYNGFAYVPYTADSAYVDAEIQLGTVLTIKNDTVVMSDRTVTIDTLSPSDLEADSLIEQKSQYPFMSNSERALQKEVSENTAAITVMDGSIESVVSATENISSDVNNLSGTVNGIQGNVGTLSGQISSLEGALSTTSSTVSQLSDSVTTTIQRVDAVPQQIADGVGELANDISVYMRYYLLNNKGVLELGDANNDFTARLDNTQLAFLQNGTAVAYLSNNKLYITEAEILTNLKIGNYQWITGTNGRMSLRWVD